MKSSLLTLSGLTIAALLAGCAAQSSTPSAAAPASATASASASTAAASAPAAKPAAPAPKKVDMTVTAYFDSGKSVLNKQAKAEIDDLLNKIKDIKLEVIVVTGYTDNRGSVAANEKLGMRRAMAAKEYLMSKGIAANEVYTDNKIDSTHKGKGSSASSRRVELEVIGYSSK